MNTISDVAKLCYNQVKMIGTLCEWNIDSYPKNDTFVVKYVGVVNVNDSYIKVKGTITNYDDTFTDFKEAFGNNDCVGKKVFVIGRLTNSFNVYANYIAISNLQDAFHGSLCGIAFSKNTLLIIDNYYHQIIENVNIEYCDNQMITARIVPNKLVVDDNGVIINDGIPKFTLQDITVTTNNDIDDIVIQALDEHEIYIEAMMQGR